LVALPAALPIYGAQIESQADSGCPLRTTPGTIGSASHGYGHESLRVEELTRDLPQLLGRDRLDPLGEGGPVVLGKPERLHGGESRDDAAGRLEGTGQGKDEGVLAATELLLRHRLFQEPDQLRGDLGNCRVRDVIVDRGLDDPCSRLYGS